MLLQAVLKCYILYFLFILCATGTVKRKRISNFRNRKLLRNAGEQESLQADADETDDTLNKDNENDRNDEEQLNDESIEKNENSREILKKERDNNLQPDIAADDKTETKFDTPGFSANKFLEISKLESIPGFNFSPAEMRKFKIWPEGIIPFYIDEFSYDKILRDNIREYLDEANSLTGLRFLELPRPPAEDNTRWVFIINRRGQLDCTDYSDKSFTYTGVQKLVIGYDCLGDGGQHIAPIILALAGVPPQHNAPDRDTYIKISMKSIQPEKTQLFTAVKSEDWLFHDIKYDFLSAGHYPCHKYTIDGSATIIPKRKKTTLIGEPDGLSYIDVQKIRMLYNFIISQGDKNAKLPDCKTLYRPGPNFKETQIVDRSSLIARKKPKKYLEAAKQAGIEVVDGIENMTEMPENKKHSNENNGKRDEADNQPNENNDKPDEADNQSNENNDKPDEADNQPNENNDKPDEADNQPKENNDKPDEADNQSIENNDKPDEADNQSNENNDKPGEADNQSNEKKIEANGNSSKEILKNSPTTDPMNWPDHTTSAE